MHVVIFDGRERLPRRHPWRILIAGKRTGMTRDLENCRIVVRESRELDLFAAMLEAKDAAALAWLRRLASGGFDDRCEALRRAGAQH